MHFKVQLCPQVGVCNTISQKWAVIQKTDEYWDHFHTTEKTIKYHKMA